MNCGVPVDLGAIGLPSFVLASREDHIVPWKSAYRTVGLLGGDTRFVLGASGHVAGVVESPRRRKSAATGRRPPPPATGILRIPGSGWRSPRSIPAAGGRSGRTGSPRHAGGTRKAPKTVGNRRRKAIEPAPGRYVKEKFNS